MKLAFRLSGIRACNFREAGSSFLFAFLLIAAPLFSQKTFGEVQEPSDSPRHRASSVAHSSIRLPIPINGPDGKIFILGTRYHYLDLYGHLIKNEYADKHQIIPAIYPHGTTPWPEKFSLEWLEKKRQQMGSIIFNSQYQNDTSLMKGHIFKEEWFRFYEENPD